jgi:hypothetical protein
LIKLVEQRVKLGISILKEEEQKRNGDNAPVIIETEQHLRTVPCRLGRFNTYRTRFSLLLLHNRCVCAAAFFTCFRVGEKIENKGGNDEKFQ